MTSPNPTSPLALSDAEFSRRLVACQTMLYRQARYVLSAEADVEDLVQETLLTLWRLRHKYTADTNFNGWAYICFQRKYYSLKQRRKQHTVLVEDWSEVFDEAGEGGRTSAHVATDFSTPHSQLEAEEVRTVLEQRVPPHYALVLKLKMLGYTNDEVSTLMHVSHEGIRRRTYAARELLRKHFFLPKRSK